MKIDYCKDPEYQRKKTGNMIPCPGEAHANPMGHDHCGTCMPRWGEIEELEPLLTKEQVDTIVKSGLMVDVVDIRDEDLLEILRERPERTKSIWRKRKGYSTNYVVVYR